MKILDVIAGLILGIYFLFVAINGKAIDFISFLKRDKSFLLWAVSVGVLYYLYSIPELKGPVSFLIALSVVGFFIIAGPKFTSNVSDIWKKLK